MSTRVTVTPVLRMDEAKVSGMPPPLVGIVLERSGHVQEQLDAISKDHAPAR